MFSTQISAFLSISLTISRPRGDFRLRVIDFLFALNWWKYQGSVSGCPGRRRRPGSPIFGFSIFTTSAPSQPSASVQDGPASNWVKSMTFTPFRKVKSATLADMDSSVSRQFDLACTGAYAPAQSHFTLSGRRQMSAHHTPEEIRKGLTHPVIDGDGHWVEYTPVFAEQIRKVTGDLGIDFGIVYPTAGLGIPRIADDATRRAVIRGFNVVTHEYFKDLGDKLTPVAVIPVHTPDEAIEELTFVTKQLGAKVCMFGSGVRRPILHAKGAPADLTRYAQGFDQLGLDPTRTHYS